MNQFTIRPPGEELFRFGPNGGLLSWNPTLAPLVAAIRKAALAECVALCESMAVGVQCEDEAAYLEAAARIRALSDQAPS